MSIFRDILKGAVIGFAIGFIGMALVADNPQSEEQIYKNTRTQTFRMLEPTSQRSGGTGFMVETPSGSKYLLTNAHVCELNSGGTMLAEQNGTFWRTAIIAVSSKTDLCLLQPIPKFKGLKLADAQALHERVYIVGHPYLNPITLTSGFTHATATPMISYCKAAFSSFPRVMPLGEFDEMLEMLNCVRSVRSVLTNAAAAPGNSGSPTVDRYGDVVGVLFAGSETGESYLVPLDDIQEFLRAY